MPTAESKSSKDHADQPAPRRQRHRLRTGLRAIGLFVVAMLVLGAVGLGGAEYYTAQPAFCGSCHIMKPYYDSWSRDIHGAKLGVRCVDCHYAPGERHTFKAKFKGLSQATSYFSGRAGGSRPRAHVNDASCLTSRCHGDEEYLTKILPIGEPRVEKRFVVDHVVEVKRQPTVMFDHGKHLRVDEALAETTREMEEIEQRLQASLSAEVFQRIHDAATSVAPAAEREADMRSLLAGLKLENLEEDAFELMRQEHLQTRRRQLKGLNCAACHSFDASEEKHLRVDLQSCFTCHFTNQAFNHETGACLQCHEPPVRQILVHDQPATQGAQPTLMDHRDIVNRKVECASCHLDVVRGSVTVTARDCTHCHDQESYLVGFEQRTTREVELYHEIHVEGQRARCVDCHHGVAHNLVEPTKVGTSANFIQVVLDECQHCHPNHHSEQVNLLMGIGGEGAPRPVPNAMFGSRMNCRGCHTNPGTDFKGAPLVEATRKTCVACHGDDYVRLYDQWMEEIANYLRESEAGIERVAKRMEEIKARGRTVPARAEALLSQARGNIHLIQAGNGIHNKNYTLQLLDLSIRGLDEALALLAGP